MNPSAPKLTIVMYHYVRPLARTRYPKIKGLDLTLFEQQLDYLTRHYSLISMEELIDATEARAVLPPRPALLTFDDGYLDHYEHVFPRLLERKLRGAFFPPSCSAVDRSILDVNKIHFVLASDTDPELLIDFIENACRERAREFSLHEVEHYRREHKSGNFLDSAEVNYIKLMLQHALPPELRAQLTDQLFRRYVAADQQAFAGELYASMDQLRTMRAEGMHIGSHGAQHLWLGYLPKAEQEADIDQSIGLLDAVGMPSTYRTMCYPYGSYNADTVDAIASRGFKVALTTEIALSHSPAAQRFALPRLDTNHLPKDAAAAPNEWTLAASA